MNSHTIARVDRTLMGVTCTVTVAGEHSAVVAHKCLDSVARYEQLWSRFLPTSDISRLNSSHGEPVWVDAATTHLVAYLQAAFSETDGRFNPTLLPLQIAAGDNSSLIDHNVSTIPIDARTHNNVDSIRLLDDGRIQLLDGVTIDAGGLAKGLAADLVTQEALGLGASKVCVNIGGDMAIHTGSDEAWPIDIVSPINTNHVLDSVLISHGGVATSAINARHRNGSTITNHIFTPAGATTSRTVGATVLASHAAWAEAWTKFAIISSPDEAIATIAGKGLAALLVLNNGSILTTDSWKELAR